MLEAQWSRGNARDLCLILALPNCVFSSHVMIQVSVDRLTLSHVTVDSLQSMIYSSFQQVSREMVFLEAAQ